MEGDGIPSRSRLHHLALWVGGARRYAQWCVAGRRGRDLGGKDEDEAVDVGLQVTGAHYGRRRAGFQRSTRP